MKTLRRAWRRLAGCLVGGRPDAELAEELESHQNPTGTDCAPECAAVRGTTDLTS